LFKRWVLKGTQISELAECGRSGKNTDTIRRYIHQFLKSPPLPPVTPIVDNTISKEIYLKADGKYFFGRHGCLLLYKKGTQLIYWSFVKRENYQNYVKDFIAIKQVGYVVLGITSDWPRSLVSATKSVFGNIPRQRCLVHTQRRCKGLLTKKPKTQAGVDLLRIVKELNHIKTKRDAKIWIKWLAKWGEEYQPLIEIRTYAKDSHGQNAGNMSGKAWWYTHKNLRATYRILTSTRNNLFVYLDYPAVDKDTNGIESEFSHLKQKINMHRGLSGIRKISAIFWYVYLTNLKRKKRHKN